jgi:hypothetical protein
MIMSGIKIKTPPTFATSRAIHANSIDRPDILEYESAR